MDILSQLQPAKVFAFFELLSSVPHGSGNTKQVSDLCVRFAAQRGLSCTRDACGNVVIRKPASPGYENAPTVILQGHLDMVCASLPEDKKDMKHEPVSLRTDGEWIWADRTSLGGDDMIAVACALAVLDDDSLPHPPLECLFTVDEETGMYGAMSLNPALLQGRRMLNLDSEDEGTYTVGCAGGVHIAAEIPVRRMPMPERSRVFRLTVSGLLGGHSGCEIDKERGNANLLCARLLYVLSNWVSLYLRSMKGGEFDNVIPSRAEAVFVAGAEFADLLPAVFEKERDRIAGELRASDPGFTAVLEPAKTSGQVLTSSDTARILSLLLILPNGVQNMSMALPGLVQTSLSQGVLRLGRNSLKFGTFIRSALNSQRDHVANRVCELLFAYGAEYTVGERFPAWEYREESPLRQKALAVYRALRGKDAAVFATHGGLECGILSEKLPGLDCIAFGPDMKDIHSVNEKLNVASVGRFYELLCAILAELKE